jgi:hypothetical protein
MCLSRRPFRCAWKDHGGHVWRSRYGGHIIEVTRGGDTPCHEWRWIWLSGRKIPLGVQAIHCIPVSALRCVTIICPHQPERRQRKRHFVPLRTHEPAKEATKKPIFGRITRLGGRVELVGITAKRMGRRVPGRATNSLLFPWNGFAILPGAELNRRDEGHCNCRSRFGAARHEPAHRRPPCLGR